MKPSTFQNSEEFQCKWSAFLTRILTVKGDGIGILQGSKPDDVKILDEFCQTCNQKSRWLQLSFFYINNKMPEIRQKWLKKQKKTPKRLCCCLCTGTEN